MKPCHHTLKVRRRLLDVREDRRQEDLPRHRHRADRRHAAGHRPVQRPCRRTAPRGERVVSVGRYRAWRFVLPPCCGGRWIADPIGRAPGQPDGRIDMVEDDASIRQSILLLLSTSPGERVMRPDYGCLLRRVVFCAERRHDGRSRHPLRPRRRRALGAAGRDPASMPALDAGPPDHGRQRQPRKRQNESRSSQTIRGMLVASLDYRVRATQAARSLNIPIDLRGEAR